MLQTNFASRCIRIQLRVTHGKPWLSLSVLNPFLIPIQYKSAQTAKNATSTFHSALKKDVKHKVLHPFHYLLLLLPRFDSTLLLRSSILASLDCLKFAIISSNDISFCSLLDQSISAGFPENTGAVRVRRGAS